MVLQRQIENSEEDRSAVVVLSNEEMEQELDDAVKAVGCSDRETAFAKLEAGEFDGYIAGTRLKTVKWLYDQEE